MATRKPKVNTNCVADRYSSPGEKIIEISSGGGGCLIALRATDAGGLQIDVYRADKGVEVNGPAHN